jgi:hypothetical protein
VITDLSNSDVVFTLTKTDNTMKIAASNKNGLDLTSNNAFCNHTAQGVVVFNFSVKVFEASRSDRLKDFKLAKKHTRCEDSNTE